MIKFEIGHYTNFKLPNNLDIPEQLQQTLQMVWDRKYRDLYERGGKYNVEEAFVEVLQAFGMPNDKVSHQRYVYMAYGIALAAKPTIKHYFPEEHKADIVQAIVSCWLKDGGEIPENWADTLFPHIDKLEDIKLLMKLIISSMACCKHSIPRQLIMPSWIFCMMQLPVMPFLALLKPNEICLIGG